MNRKLITFHSSLFLLLVSGYMVFRNAEPDVLLNFTLCHLLAIMFFPVKFQSYRQKRNIYIVQQVVTLISFLFSVYVAFNGILLVSSNSLIPITLLGFVWQSVLFGGLLVLYWRKATYKLMLTKIVDNSYQAPLVSMVRNLLSVIVIIFLLYTSIAFQLDTLLSYLGFFVLIVIGLDQAIRVLVNLIDFINLKN